MKTRLFSAVLAVVLALGLAPLPAFAQGFTPSSTSFQTQSTSANPTSISLGSMISGYASDGNDQWYTFTTTGAHSAYQLELASMGSGWAYYHVYGASGSEVCQASTKTKITKTLLLSANSQYRVKVTSGSGAGFTFQVTEIPSAPQYGSLGNDKNAPYALTLGQEVNSQFDDPSGSQEQWYEFTTTSQHSAYEISLFSRMDGKWVYWSLYNPYGYELTQGSTTTKMTKNVLLTSDTTYRLKLSASYGGSSGYPSYEIRVAEIPSNPQHPSLGKDKNNPYRLTMGEAASSQFDDRSGSQEQWLAFTAGDSELPYLIELTSEMSGKNIYWRLYDHYGDEVAQASTRTKLTKGVALVANETYTLKVDASYGGSEGFPSYKVKVSQLSLGKTAKLKLKRTSNRGFSAKWSKASGANCYEIAYKGAKERSWSYMTTSTNSQSWSWMTSYKKYKVKVRPLFELNGKYFAGKWTPVKKVRPRR